MSWGWWVASLVWGLLIVVGSVIAYTQHCWLSRAAFAQGTVVGLVIKKDMKRPTFTPQVSYTTPDGQSHTFDAAFGSNPPAFAVGETVPVAYDPATSTASIPSFR